MADEFEDIGRRMHAWAKELWPLPRSITGPGIRQSLDWVAAHHPELRLISFKTGEKVFDWEVPREWVVRDAFIEHESGRRFAEFSKSNLHVLGYSLPMDRTVARSELLDLIFTQPDQPDRIPYVTSYYADRHGFCMSADDKAALPEGRYRAYIDSELKDGALVLGELVIKGDSDAEILFSTYLCHPSMANNELSGPVLATALAHYIKALHPSPKYSYRILFLAETIGSIAYLSRYAEALKKQVVMGYVLSCVGDDRAYSHVQSRSGDTLADVALSAALAKKTPVSTYSFLSRGSDERQFCAPGIDLPVCGFCRSKYGEYPEYHTDADDLTLVTPAGLQGSFAIMRAIIDAVELGLLPKATVLCEPQLGKRGLYPTISQKSSYNAVKCRRDVLAYSDGKTSVFELATRIDQPLEDVVSELKLLTQHDLIAWS